MYDESIFFMGAQGASSTASLLFAPERVLSLHDARRENTFEEGRDYEVGQDRGTVVRLPGSRMPCTAPEDVTPLICAADDAFHRRQVEVTYTHAGGWDGPTPLRVDEAVPGTIRRLRAAEPVRVALTGDSISEGYNASGFIRVPPYQAAYGALVATGLEQAYGSPIEYGGRRRMRNS
jgi:acyl-CoA thioesterase I